MNIICLLWKHDWEKIKTINEEELVKKINESITDYKIPKGNYKKLLHKKVCLRCGIKRDEINNYFTRTILKVKEDKIRKQSAKDIWRHT